MKRPVCSELVALHEGASSVTRNKHGMMTHITQTLKLEDTPKTNSRFFNAGKTLCPHWCRGSCPTGASHSLVHGWALLNVCCLKSEADSGIWLLRRQILFQNFKGQWDKEKLPKLLRFYRKLKP